MGLLSAACQRVMKTKLIVTAIFLLGASQAQADGNDIYVGASLGNNSFDFAGEPGFTVEDSSSAFKLFAGYNITKNIAVEFQYADLGKYDVSATISGIAINGDIDVSNTSLSGVYKWNTEGKFSPFAKLGYGRTKAELTASAAGVTANSDTSESGVVAGFGAEYNVTDTIAIRGEWERIDAGEDNADLLSVGAVFNF